jgi:predicted dehydrogenase
MTGSVSQLTDRMRVAVVGGGFMGEVHARAARAAGARLVGVASRSAASSEGARSRLGAEVAYPSVAALLADDTVDVVHVCTPNDSHADIARQVLAAGRHVVCEKPLATTATEAQELTDLATASGRVAVVPFVYRFHPMVREARARIASGATGRVFSVHGAYLQDWLASPEDDDWRVDPAFGGPSRAFADIGSHLCDLLEFVTGDRISRVSARVRTVHADRAVHKAVTTEDVAVVVFETDAAVVGTLHVSQVSAGHKNALSFQIAGARESLAFDQECPDLLHVGTAAGTTAVPRSPGLSAEAARYSVVPPGHPQGYQDAFNALVADAYRAVRGDAPTGLPTFADGRRTAQVTEAVLESSRTGAWVETPWAPASRPSAELQPAR